MLLPAGHWAAGEPEELHLTGEDWQGIMDQLTGYVAARKDALTGDLWTYCAAEMEQLTAAADAG